MGSEQEAVIACQENSHNVNDVALGELKKAVAEDARIPPSVKALLSQITLGNYDEILSSINNILEEPLNVQNPKH